MFQRQLLTALRLGFEFVPAEELRPSGGRPRQLAITFDDGLTSVASAAVPILSDLGIPSTLFVVGAWAEGQHQFGEGVLLDWAQIERLAARGVSIGSHSMTHRNFRDLSEAEIEYELAESRRLIATRTGQTPTAFAIPYGQSGDWPALASPIARAAGYEVVYAQSEHRRPPDTLGRSFVCSPDGLPEFRALLNGAFDDWEEWL
jgi:peptidoglycan/xylan/chitin deacetylase (PgdA/CDA1 family)